MSENPSNVTKSKYSALCCPCWSQNSANFAEFLLQRERPYMEAFPHPALCCPCCSQNSANFAELSLQTEIPIMEASSHPALCWPCSPLVHLDRVLQVPPFHPHQPPQTKTHPARRPPNFWLQPLMPPLVPFRFQTHLAFGLPPPVHLDRFLPAPPFQPHQVPQKKAHPACINPKFWLQPRMLHLVFVCFQDHLAPDLLHVRQSTQLSSFSLYSGSRPNLVNKSENN